MIYKKKYSLKIVNYKVLENFKIIILYYLILHEKTNIQ